MQYRSVDLVIEDIGKTLRLTEEEIQKYTAYQKKSFSGEDKQYVDHLLKSKLLLIALEEVMRILQECVNDAVRTWQETQGSNSTGDRDIWMLAFDTIEDMKGQKALANFLSEPDIDAPVFLPQLTTMFYTCVQQKIEDLTAPNGII